MLSFFVLARPHRAMARAVCSYAGLRANGITCGCGVAPGALSVRFFVSDEVCQRCSA
jgi:hypothetical protein